MKASKRGEKKSCAAMDSSKRDGLSGEVCMKSKEILIIKVKLSKCK